MKGTIAYHIHILLFLMRLHILLEGNNKLMGYIDRSSVMVMNLLQCSVNKEREFSSRQEMDPKIIYLLVWENL
jgi:hypothetical protein